MKTLAVLSRKGGAGKTTVAVNLALAAHQAGLKVVLADIDPLRSAGEVLRAREDAAALLLETTAAKLFVLRDACERNGCDLLIVDTPTAPDSDVLMAVHVADLSLTVARPTMLDVAAATQSVNLVQRAGSPGLIVLNQCPAQRGGRELSVVEQAMERLRFARSPLAAVNLRSRVAYQHAFTHNRAVTEWDPAGEAAGDLLRLLADVCDRMRLPLAAPPRTADPQAQRSAATPVPIRLLQAGLPRFLAP